jgi:pre-mRNA-splicing factor 38A
MPTKEDDGAVTLEGWCGVVEASTRAKQHTEGTGTDAVMANATDPFAQQVHGTNPQYLIEKITRLKIINCRYWKESCFGLTSELLIDKAIALKYVGGSYGGQSKPSNFLCLVLKMLQLQPEKEIVLEFIRNEDFKYLRLLGAFYMRMVGRPEEVYQELEP